MADLGNQKIKDTYQFVLQTDNSGNLQNLSGGTPNPLIVNNNLRYLDGNQADGYVLLSDSSGNASWGPVAFSGDVYVTAGTIDNTIIKLYASSGGTVSIPGLSWSSSTSGHISNSGLTGNVGIGTSTPNTKLTVVGGVSGSTHLYAGDIQINSSGYVVKGSDNRMFFPASDTSNSPNILYGYWGMQDYGHFYWGSDEDLDIYHTGSQGFIDNDTGTLNILSSALKLGDTTSEVTVQDNLVVNDDLTVNANTLYVDSTNNKVGVNTINPDALLTVSGTTGFTSFNLQSGSFTVVNNNTRIRFNSPATTNGLVTGQQLQITIVGTTYTVTIDTVPDTGNVYLTEVFPGPTTSNITTLNYNGASNKLFKVYDGVNPSFQVSGSTVMSGTTDLLDIFSTASMSGTVVSVGITGTDGIEVDSGSPITDSGTITLGLNDVDATKIADGSVTDTEFQYINTLSSNAQTQINTKLSKAGGTMTGDLSLGTNQINELAEPTLDNDAATKGYVDAKVATTDSLQEVTDIGNDTTNSISTAGLTSSGVVDVTNTTDASDDTGDTGALRTEGGASIAKKLYVGTGIVGDLTGDVTGNADTATKIASITNSNIVQLTDTQTLTNKTLTSPTLTTPALGTPGSGTLTNCTGYPASALPSSIDATKIADGSVTNTEFQYINTLSSNAQTQITARLQLAGGTMSGDIAMGTNKITGMGDPTAAQDAATKTYVDNSARFFAQTTGAIKLLASNNWAGFNRTTGGLDSSGFWNVDTGSGTIGTAYNYYGSYRNTFFTVPYACKLTRMVIQGANTTNSQVGQDWNIHLAKSPVVDDSDSISWAAVTGVTKTLPDNRDKRFIYDISIDQSCAQFDTFFLAFQGTNSADTWLSMNVILEFEYTLT
tara:strand:- start:456 stop:3107 length:2652 start_codon:yes stop_codon:yes gene_type:complete